MIWLRKAANNLTLEYDVKNDAVRRNDSMRGLSAD